MTLVAQTLIVNLVEEVLCVNADQVWIELILEIRDDVFYWVVFV